MLYPLPCLFSPTHPIFPSQIDTLFCFDYEKSMAESKKKIIEVTQTQKDKHHMFSLINSS